MTIYEQQRQDDAKTQGFRTYTRYFKFTISNPGASGENKGGFIDPIKAQDYTDFNWEGNLEDYEDKARGYIRWFNLCLNLSRFGIFYQDVKEVAGATSTDTPTSVTFVMGYDNANEEALYWKDASGKEYKGAEEVFKYLIGFVMANDYKSFAAVYDPTVDDIGRNPSGGHLGITDKFLTAEKLCDDVESAYSYITMEEIDNPITA